MLFADEPTGALDTANTGIVLRVLRELATEDCSVVMVTHDVESTALADTVIFLRDGHVVAQLGDPSRDRVLDALRELGEGKEPRASQAPAGEQQGA